MLPRARVSTTRARPLVTGFGGDGSGGGAYGEPFGGADDSAQGASPFSGADGGIALFGEGGGLGLFVGQVALGGG